MKHLLCFETFPWMISSSVLAKPTFLLKAVSPYSSIPLIATFFVLDRACGKSDRHVTKTKAIRSRLSAQSRPPWRFDMSRCLMFSSCPWCFRVVLWERRLSMLRHGPSPLDWGEIRGRLPRAQQVRLASPYLPSLIIHSLYFSVYRAIELNPTKARYYHFRGITAPGWLGVFHFIIDWNGDSGFLHSCAENAEHDPNAQRQELVDYDKALSLNYRRGALLYNNIGYVYYEQEYELHLIMIWLLLFIDWLLGIGASKMLWKLIKPLSQVARGTFEPITIGTSIYGIAFLMRS